MGENLLKIFEIQIVEQNDGIFFQHSMSAFIKTHMKSQMHMNFDTL